MQDTVLIQVSNLSRDYGQLRAVDNISFEARRGEVLGFLGPNGAGKSSTMQMLSGNLAPTTGQILINGIDLQQQPALAKANIGYLPEHPPLYKELTVDEYLDYCAALHGLNKSQRKPAIEKAMQQCGLTQMDRRLIAHLSKGYQQRIGIAQAILHKPSIIILDEPTVGLDPIQIREIRELIRTLGRDYCVILSTHILPEVQSVCDKVQIIHQGHLILHERLDQIQQQQHIRLDVMFARAPELAELEKLEGVISVQTIAETEFQIQCQSQQETAPRLAALAVQHDWGLLELTPYTRELEDIFVDIISSEQSTEYNSTITNDYQPDSVTS